MNISKRFQAVVPVDKMPQLALGLCFLFGHAPGLLAASGDSVNQGKFEEAKTLYAQRANAGKIEQAIGLLDEAEAGTADTDLQYDVLILNARAVYWLGAHAEGEENKRVFFERSYKKAAAAKELFPNFSEGPYFYGLALSRWMEQVPEWRAYLRLDELTENLISAANKKTRAGKFGGFIDGLGPYRILGKIDMAQSRRAAGLKKLGDAYAHAKDYVLNAVFYAEALDGQGDRERACAVLKELLANDPRTLNPERIAETVEEWPEALELHGKMSCR